MHEILHRAKTQPASVRIQRYEDGLLFTIGNAKNYIDYETAWRRLGYKNRKSLSKRMRAHMITVNLAALYKYLREKGATEQARLVEDARGKTRRGTPLRAFVELTPQLRERLSMQQPDLFKQHAPGASKHTAAKPPSSQRVQKATKPQDLRSAAPQAVPQTTPPVAPHAEPQATPRVATDEAARAVAETARLTAKTMERVTLFLQQQAAYTQQLFHYIFTVLSHGTSVPALPAPPVFTPTPHVAVGATGDGATVAESAMPELAPELAAAPEHPLPDDTVVRIIVRALATRIAAERGRAEAGANDYESAWNRLYIEVGAAMPGFTKRRYDRLAKQKKLPSIISAIATEPETLAVVRRVAETLYSRL